MNGNEHIIANVTIDGVGSSWQITGDPANDNQATLAVSRSANATATIDVKNGGQLVVTGIRDVHAQR